MGSPNEPISLREAIALATETGEVLGGRVRQALELLVAIANRDMAETQRVADARRRTRPPSSGQFEAVKHATNSAMAFAKARAELENGKREIGRITDRFEAVDASLKVAESEILSSAAAIRDEALAPEEPTK